ncbi:UNKNOWN [Stylonychia lemnae]|uniref:Uncharacterized protein n=1 Tax=Stylonychia lemnae TaxID=5949 RepID=A0A078ATX7_STYLE|nr:UNKNOWN [Stylonychia lemnae]|eukprot:CDW84697.1 UNKNOWN [Stylonychia lemnae]
MKKSQSLENIGLQNTQQKNPKSRNTLQKQQTYSGQEEQAKLTFGNQASNPKEDKAKIATIKLNNYIKQVKNILEDTQSQQTLTKQSSIQSSIVQSNAVMQIDNSRNQGKLGKFNSIFTQSQNINSHLKQFHMVMQDQLTSYQIDQQSAKSLSKVNSFANQNEIQSILMNPMMQESNTYMNRIGDISRSNSRNKIQTNQKQNCNIMPIGNGYQAGINTLFSPLQNIQNTDHQLLWKLETSATKPQLFKNYDVVSLVSYNSSRDHSMSKVGLSQFSNNDHSKFVQNSNNQRYSKNHIFFDNHHQQSNTQRQRANLVKGHQILKSHLNDTSNAQNISYFCKDTYDDELSHKSLDATTNSTNTIVKSNFISYQNIAGMNSTSNFKLIKNQQQSRKEVDESVCSLVLETDENLNEVNFRQPYTSDVDQMRSILEKAPAVKRQSQKYNIENKISNNNGTQTQRVIDNLQIEDCCLIQSINKDTLSSKIKCLLSNQNSSKNNASRNQQIGNSKQTLHARTHEDSIKPTSSEKQLQSETKVISSYHHIKVKLEQIKQKQNKIGKQQRQISVISYDLNKQQQQYDYPRQIPLSSQNQIIDNISSSSDESTPYQQKNFLNAIQTQSGSQNNTLISILRNGSSNQSIERTFNHSDMNKQNISSLNNLTNPNDHSYSKLALALTSNTTREERPMAYQDYLAHHQKDSDSNLQPSENSQFQFTPKFYRMPLKQKNDLIFKRCTNVIQNNKERKDKDDLLTPEIPICNRTTRMNNQLLFRSKSIYE